ncbi:MAG TPA: hypothetical protein PLL36_14450 [Candidatus Hydrogenedentes bacterium]|jgi:hypothetical protein|nr:MAG: hypothetical protein BWX80_00100 [Candidatus Hydrogenedentes bacterium ADurb.Bin101]HOC68142.1 hypothetical protein [Candidatus Hydrogenedentota bacterium]HQN02277.1 hypothetical protein [Candidatus Hydrogenedentota bacterium]
MRLEEVEEICLSFLRHTTNPMVSIETLCAACGKKKVAISPEELAGFLRHHTEVVIVDGVDATAPVSPSEFSGAGIDMGTRAILKSRIPTRREMTELMQQQLEHMRFHLQDALIKARKHQDHDAMEEIEAALKKNRQLEMRFKSFMDNGDGVEGCESV